MLDVDRPLVESASESDLTPPEIVRELDRYIIAQGKAKRAVAIALRNRWRRLRVSEEFRDEITPKNIIMIGPTGVGKTEISRRLAKLAGAPFVKVEASKFTEVGYVGRDVESIVRDLAEAAYQLARSEARDNVLQEAERLAEERLLDLLLPGSAGEAFGAAASGTGPEEEVIFLQDERGIGHGEAHVKSSPTREKLRQLLRQGRLDERLVELEITRQPQAQLQLLGPQGFNEIEGQLKEMFSSLVPPRRETKKVTVKEGRALLIQEAQDTLIDSEKVREGAVRRAEQTGIVFIDEIDKICTPAGGGGRGPDVSREGVQRDLLPLVEGSTVNTKYGAVRTDHVLFIASGAFHQTKPSDLMPEFQGRFPIRVELTSLSAEDFARILREPENALTKQYTELLKAENVTLQFTDDGIEQLAALTAEVNTRTENIGARRLHTLLEKVLEEVSFSAHDYAGKKIVIDQAYVRDRLQEIVKDTDLSRYIL